jgi:hypothetical protein
MANGVRLDALGLRCTPVSADNARMTDRPPRAPMYLCDVEAHEGTGFRADAIRRVREAGRAVPQIWHLFAFKPDRTDALAAFTQGVLRGPSPLSPGERELIAAFTSKRNQCLY